jgi:hypothetical protein
MPWSMKNPPNVAKNWPAAKQRACIVAGNAVLRDGGSDEEAIRACIGAAKKAGGETEDENAGERVVDLFGADKVLSGQPVRVLPVSAGYWKDGTKKSPITPDVLERILLNWNQRGEVGLYQSNLPLNIEHDELGGKIGHLSDLILGDDGLYATFDLTEAGKQLLGAGRFDYLSPEIVWDLLDSKTGTALGPAIVGMAVTNYPFFGDSTAMFSREAGELFEAQPLVDAGSESGGFSVADLMTVVRSMVKNVLGTQKTMEVNTMAEETTTQPPAPTPAPEEFSARMALLEQQAETFAAALREREAQIAQQAETIHAQSAQITDLNAARMRETFSHQVAGLPHVGAEKGTLVEELMWLHQADSGERNHFSFWTNLLATVEKGLAESAAFKEIGRSGAANGGSAYGKFSAKVGEHLRQQGLVAAPGDKKWAQAAIEVAETEPALYQEYLAQQRAQ